MACNCAGHTGPALHVVRGHTEAWLGLELGPGLPGPECQWLGA